MKIAVAEIEIPSGKHTKNYGRSPFLIGKSTISMAMFNSYVSLPEGTHKIDQWSVGTPCQRCPVHPQCFPNLMVARG